MQKEVIGVFLVAILLVPFSQAQLNSIEIEDVNVNDNSIQVLIQNNFNQDFNKITFIINSQYTIIQDNELKALETKFFVVNYPGGIKLETIKVIVGDQSADYVFTGNEDMFVVNQEISSTTSTTESNSPISYIYSNQRLAKLQDNNVVYYHSDNIGSTSLQTDVNSNIKFKANYLPFGKELSFSSINEQRYGFTGKELDTESSLNYFNARYYIPSNGKFISNDPIFKPTEGGYQYVSNNPLTITDPSGKQASADATYTDIGYPSGDYKSLQVHIHQQSFESYLATLEYEKTTKKVDMIQKLTLTAMGADVVLAFGGAPFSNSAPTSAARPRRITPRLPPRMRQEMSSEPIPESIDRKREPPAIKKLIEIGFFKPPSPKPSLGAIHSGIMQSLNAGESVNLVIVKYPGKENVGIIPGNSHLGIFRDQVQTQFKDNDVISIGIQLTKTEKGVYLQIRHRGNSDNGEPLRIANAALRTISSSNQGELGKPGTPYNFYTKIDEKSHGEWDGTTFEIK